MDDIQTFSLLPFSMNLPFVSEGDRTRLTSFLQILREWTGECEYPDRARMELICYLLSNRGYPFISWAQRQVSTTYRFFPGVYMQQDFSSQIGVLIIGTVRFARLLFKNLVSAYYSGASSIFPPP